MKHELMIGSRGSRLALWQAHYIAERLQAAHTGLNVKIERVATTGDKILDVPLAKIGGKGLFTKELESAMLDGAIDLAVHSLKDMPTQLPEGLVLAAVTKRSDPFDALVSPRYKTLEKLPPNARVGTSSLRRQAQLLAVRPDLKLANLRGNVGTRLEKAEDGTYDAVVLAAAGLKRLGLGDKITQILPLNVSLPAVGQGALAIEARGSDASTLALLSALDHAPTRTETYAERAFLRAVEGGCQVPVGVYAVLKGNALQVQAVIASLDGKTVVRDAIEGSAETAEELGLLLAERMLRNGGREIMQSIGLWEEKR